MLQFVGGHCPPAPPAPAFGNGTEAPSPQLGSTDFIFRDFLEGDFIPLKLPLNSQQGDILTLDKAVTF